uniref:Uncharacterized protein n=1 Tax=Oscillatoriales cyanobacterium SpSt-418 TaxID=2282169 RepID=A0A7C3PFT0_9CYAN
MNDCPCCKGNLLRHIRNSGVYWFCPTCRQEMPNLVTEIHRQQNQLHHSRKMSLDPPNSV